MADHPSTTAGEGPAVAHEQWLGEPEELLPRRPRRRIVGVGGWAGGTPILALLGVLLATCGFIAGVLIEKGETSSSAAGGSAASSLIGRFRALRGSATAAGSSGTGSAAASSAGSGFARPTAGTVAYLAGHTLYVTNAEGNTIKVTTSAATSVTKTVRATVKAIHPGETVTVTGEAGADGAVRAESISVGAGGGALAALFGSDGTATRPRSTGGSRGEPSLFGG